jgi:hypothetical protein
LTTAATFLMLYVLSMKMYRYAQHYLEKKNEQT